MKLEFEFLAVNPGRGSVTYQSTAINWTRPKYRLSMIPGDPFVKPVPALVGRPGGKAIPLNQWLSLNICY
jgi:hypothetical protein